MTISARTCTIRRDTILCSDGDTAYAAFVGQRAILHYVLNASQGPHVLHNAFHIQTIDNLHNRFEVFMKAFRGTASKYLPAYSAWCVSRLAGDEAAAVEDAWKRLLAAWSTRKADIAFFSGRLTRPSRVSSVRIF